MAAALGAGLLIEFLGRTGPVRSLMDGLLYGVAGWVLNRFPVYRYVDASLFWSIYHPSQIREMAIALTMGATAAAIARQKETVAAVSLGVLWAAMATLMFSAWPRPPIPAGMQVFITQVTRVEFVLRHVLATAVLIAVGGWIPRSVRAASGRDETPAPI
jgi:hypothetical protein